MSNHMQMQVAVIGAGISGITAAHVLQKHGHRVTVFERAPRIGGVWAVAYPEVRLQNVGSHYHLSDFPWPFEPDLHPTAAQITTYLNQAVKQLNLDVRTQHEVIALEEQDRGWLLRYKNSEGQRATVFDYVVVSVGQYTQAKPTLRLPNEALFAGEIITERDVRDLDMFVDKEVVVVGFGKSAVDMAAFAASRGARVHHVFRTPRWLIPQKIFGIHYSYPLFSRFGTVMMPSWAYPTSAERFLNHNLRWFTAGFWSFLQAVFKLHAQYQGWGKNDEARQRLKAILPQHKLVPDLRSAAALAPQNYFRFVAEGQIWPHHSELTSFAHEGVQLQNGSEISCDMVVLSLGSQTPTFPFFPQKYRQLLESEPDGVQLYRHLIHPHIPRVGFAGFNHGFLHVPGVEVGTLWLCAHLRGDLILPSVAEMEQSIEYIRQWKREHITFEPSRSCAVSTRYQQYLDILLKDLGLSPYRKWPNILAEVFGRYGPADYQGVMEEYDRQRVSQLRPPALQPVQT